MDIILSTRNPSKAEQIKASFKGLPISILTLAEAGIEGEAVEDGLTLEQNALKKALFAHEYSSPDAWTMADDTGIFIHHLHGAPGIRASRWAGDTASTEDIIQHTLKQLDGATDRSATFETTVAVITPDGAQHFFTGKVNGTILEAARTAPQPKMPYSAIFVPDGTDLVWAEMSPENENRISQRGKAFKLVREFLEKFLK